MKKSHSIPWEDESLSARWLVPRGASSLLVLAHGAGAGMDHPFLVAVAEGLANEKVATLRFQFPYMESGRRRPDSPKIAVSAWEAAIQAVTAKSRLPLFVGGKSFGGRMAAHWASQSSQAIRGLVFLGYPFQGVSPRPQPQRLAVLKQTSGPLLFLQGDRDKLGPLSLVQPTVTALGRRAKLHVVRGGDHGFEVLKRSGRTPDEVFDEICQTVAQWMDKKKGTLSGR